MKLPVRNGEGKELRTLDVDDSVFGILPNEAVLHQAFVIQRNNQRWGTANTKTRGEVQGSTRKVRAQKYTGKARAGSNRSPTRVGGGIVFGPRQRDYSQKMPKKMRRLAIRSALSGKAAGGQLVVVDQISLEKPKTKEITRLLHAVGLERSALLVTARSDRMVLASSRNLQKTKVLPAAHLNVVDMMNHTGLLMTEEAVRVAEQLWGRAKAEVAPVEEKPPAAKARRLAKAVPAPDEDKRPAARPRRAARAAVPTPAAVEAPAAEALVETPEAKAPARARTPKATAAAKRPAAGAVAAAEEKPKRARRTAAKKPAPKVNAPAAAGAAKTPKPRRAAAKPTTPKAKAPAAAGAAKTPKPRRAAAKPAAPKAKAPAAAAAAETPKPRRRTKQPAEGEA